MAQHQDQQKRGASLSIAGIESEYNNSITYGALPPDVAAGASNPVLKASIGSRGAKKIRNNYTSRERESRLNSSLLNRRASDRSSLAAKQTHAGVHDSVDSPSMLRTRRGDHHQRGTAATIDCNDEHNGVREGSRLESMKNPFTAGPTGSTIVKFNNQFLNQTPKTAQSQLGQPRNRMRDKKGATTFKA